MKLNYDVETQTSNLKFHFKVEVEDFLLILWHNFNFELFIIFWHNFNFVA